MSESDNSDIMKGLTWVAFIVIGIIFGIGPFRNCHSSSNSGVQSVPSYTPSSSSSSSYSPSFTGTGRRNCRGNHNTCDCPNSQRTLEDAHIWNCGCGHPSSWHN